MSLIEPTMLNFEWCYDVNGSSHVISIWKRIDSDENKMRWRFEAVAASQNCLMSASRPSETDGAATVDMQTHLPILVIQQTRACREREWGTTLDACLACIYIRKVPIVIVPGGLHNSHWSYFRRAVSPRCSGYVTRNRCKLWIIRD